MPEEILDKKGVIKATAIAAVVALIGIAVLGWQYRQIEKKLPTIEEAIEEEKEAREEKAARDILDRFMLTRVGQEEHIAKMHLTEKAAEQMRLGEFSLIDNFSLYEVLSTEKLEEQKYRFAVRIHYEEISIKPIEVITLIKIPELDNYFVDSVEIAG